MKTNSMNARNLAGGTALIVLILWIGTPFLIMGIFPGSAPEQGQFETVTNLNAYFNADAFGKCNQEWIAQLVQTNEGDLKRFYIQSVTSTIGKHFSQYLNTFDIIVRYVIDSNEKRRKPTTISKNILCSFDHASKNLVVLSL